MFKSNCSLFRIKIEWNVCELFLSGTTALDPASYGGHKEVVQMLINAGADIDVQDKK